MNFMYGNGKLIKLSPQQIVSCDTVSDGWYATLFSLWFCSLLGFLLLAHTRLVLLFETVAVAGRIGLTTTSSRLAALVRRASYFFCFFAPLLLV
jgi:hypothetical protein